MKPGGGWSVPSVTACRPSASAPTAWVSSRAGATVMVGALECMLTRPPILTVSLPVDAVVPNPAAAAGCAGWRLKAVPPRESPPAGSMTKVSSFCTLSPLTASRFRCRAAWCHKDYSIPTRTRPVSSASDADACSASNPDRSPRALSTAASTASSMPVMAPCSESGGRESGKLTTSC